MTASTEKERAEKERTEKERAEFEAAYVAEKLRIIGSEGSADGERAIRRILLRRNANGDYDNLLEAHFAWWAWQAARQVQVVPQEWRKLAEDALKVIIYKGDYRSRDRRNHKLATIANLKHMLAAAPQPPAAAQLDDIGVADMAKRAALSAGPGIQKAVQALIDAAILEGGALPPSQEAAMQATDQRKADLLKLLEPFIGTPLNE